MANSPKISIITPTVRPKGIDIVRKALQKQTFKDFEWLIGTPYYLWVHGTYFDGEEILEPKDKITEQLKMKTIIDDFKGGFWSLNRIYNKLIKEAKGELIVSWQDWISAKPDALEKFWKTYQDTKGIVSGVGDQYEEVDKFGKPQIKIWSDPRRTSQYGSFYECFPQDCEWNFCAVPRKAMFDIGGFDEEMDFRCRGVDAIQVVKRLDLIGYKFYLDQTNESFTVRHNRDNYGGDEEWNKTHGLFNGQYEQRQLELESNGLWPILKYLK